MKRRKIQRHPNLSSNDLNKLDQDCLLSSFHLAHKTPVNFVKPLNSSSNSSNKEWSNRNKFDGKTMKTITGGKPNDTSSEIAIYKYDFLPRSHAPAWECIPE